MSLTDQHVRAMEAEMLRRQRESDAIDEAENSVAKVFRSIGEYLERTSCGLRISDVECTDDATRLRIEFTGEPEAFYNLAALLGRR